jgi:hypothetical protein
VENILNNSDTEDYTFYSLDQDKLPELDLEIRSQKELRALAYYIWCFFPENEPLLLWRKEKLLPLIQPALLTEDETDVE